MEKSKIEDLKKLFDEMLGGDSEIFISDEKNTIEIVGLNYNELKLIISKFKDNFEIMETLSKFVEENNTPIFACIPANDKKEVDFYFSEKIGNVYFYLGSGASYIQSDTDHIILSIEK